MAGKIATDNSVVEMKPEVQQMSSVVDGPSVLPFDCSSVYLKTGNRSRWVRSPPCLHFSTVSVRKKVKKEARDERAFAF